MYNICAAMDRMILQLSDRRLLSLTLFPTLLLFASLLTISYAIDCNSRPAYTNCVEDMEQRVSEVPNLPSNPCNFSETKCMYYDYTEMYIRIMKLHFTQCRIGIHVLGMITMYLHDICISTAKICVFCFGSCTSAPLAK